jgi:hypothetical protein
MPDDATDLQDERVPPAVTAPEPTDRLEQVASIVLAVAVVLTAWAAFEAGKWGGQMSIKFSEAAAARTESTRNDTRAGQLTQIDVAMFIDWVTALSNDLGDGAIPEITSAEDYQPTPGTVSGFLFLRMRDEFKPALNAWLATDPINNPEAPPSPFAMADYRVAESAEADRLAAQADEAAADARSANQNGDNYVLTAVLFAAVLFFSGVASRLQSRWNRRFVNLIGIVGVTVGVVILFSLPILI